jgi:hypothetical protein
MSDSLLNSAELPPPTILVKLNEFEREMTLKNTGDVVDLMRKLYSRELEMVRTLPTIANHNQKIEDYTLKYEGLKMHSKRQSILREKNPIRLDKVEFMWTIGLSNDSYIAFIALTAIGGEQFVATNPFEVFKAFGQFNCYNAIVIHTHPSEMGQVRPSPQDMEFTKSLLYNAKHAYVTLVDHIILGINSFYSFRGHDKLTALQLELDNEVKGIKEIVKEYNEKKSLLSKNKQELISELEKQDEKNKKLESELNSEREQRIEQDRKIADQAKENQQLKAMLAQFAERLKKAGL